MPLDNQQTSKTIKWPRLAIVAPALPFIGYFMAFVYQWSYIDYFNLPSFLIKISVEDVVRSTGTLIMVLLVASMVVLYGYPLIMSWRRHDKTSFIGVIFALVFAAQSFYDLFSSEMLKTILVHMVMIALAFFRTFLLFHIITFSIKKVWKIEKLGTKDIRLGARKYQNRVNLYEGHILNFLFYSSYSPFLGILIISVFLISAFSLIGFHNAEYKRNYLTFRRSGSKYILIEKYDLLVAAKISGSTITRDILLLNTASDFEFKQEYLPNLHK
jgi:hypothetical protein